MYHWHCRCHWADSVETTWDFHHPCMILRHVEQKFSTPIFTQLLSRPTRQRYQNVTAAAEQPSRDFMNFKIRVILPVARHLVTEGATREFLALDTRKARLAEVKTWRRADMIWWFRIVDSAQLSVDVGVALFRGSNSKCSGWTPEVQPFFRVRMGIVRISFPMKDEQWFSHSPCVRASLQDFANPLALWLMS